MKLFIVVLIFFCTCSPVDKADHAINAKAVNATKAPRNFVKSLHNSVTDGFTSIITWIKNEFERFFSNIFKISKEQQVTKILPLYQFGNPNAEKNALIIVAIHGNEPCGVHAFQQLNKNGYFNRFKNIKVTIAVGNPIALAAGKRFMDENLNRLFTEDIIQGEARNEEQQRAQELAVLISECHGILDVHSSSDSSPPFAFSRSSCIEKAVNLPVDYVITNVLKYVTGTSLGWAERSHVKDAFVVECGQHEDPKSVDVAMKSMRIFLELMEKEFSLCAKESLDLNIMSNEPFQQRKASVLKCNGVEIVKNGFKFMHPVASFDFIQYGEIVASDENGNIACPFKKGSYLFMPTKKPFIGEEAWFWATIE